MGNLMWILLLLGGYNLLKCYILTRDFIIGELKKCSDYELLTIEEQDKLFYDLMNPEKRSD